MTSVPDEDNAALHLQGRELDDGWRVGTLNKRPPDATGGHFSVSYTVQHSSGRYGFMKVLNVAAELDDIDRLQQILSEYIYERDLVMMCAEKHLSRVVVGITHGQFTSNQYRAPNVNYIIFELATTDIRIAFNQGATVDLVLKLDMLHSLATGIRQLHTQGVAHQDVKPSNLLVFDKDEDGRTRGKVADLGRAYRPDHPSLHDHLPMPGDRNYAPPEQLYGHVYPDDAERRYAADLYQIGNLATFIFFGSTMNSLLSSELNAQHHWGAFGDSYGQVLPYVRDAFVRSISRLSAQDPTVPAEIIAMIGYLCEPDAQRRGHPRTVSRPGPNYALERVVAQLDLLSRRAVVDMARSQ